MTDYAADQTSGYGGGSLTKRTGTTNSDTVPAGSWVTWVNAGAGAHTVTLASNNAYQGLAITARVITIPAGGAWAGAVDPLAGDSNGRVGVAINGTAAEVSYYITARS